MAVALLAARLGLRRLVPASSLQVLNVPIQRAFSEAPAPEVKKVGSLLDDGEDIVLSTFIEYQQQFRALLKAMKETPTPLEGDDNAIREYMTKIESVKKEIGMPDMWTVLSAELKYKLRCARGNVREFLAEVTNGVDFGEDQEMVDELWQKLEEIEETTEADLDLDNTQAMQELAEAAREISANHGLTDFDQAKDEAMFELYKRNLAKVREEVLEGIEAVKRREGLEDINVDLSTLTPKYL